MVHIEIDTATQSEELNGGQIYYTDSTTGKERSALLTQYSPGSSAITLFNIGADGVKRYYTINVSRLADGKFRWASRESLRRNRDTALSNDDTAPDLAGKIIALESQVTILTDILRRTINALRDKKIID